MRSFLIQLCGIALLSSSMMSGQAKAPEERPAPRFDISSIDKSIDPCVDFYQFACNNWIKNNPMPADYTDWISFSEVEEHNNAVLRRILDKAKVNDPKRSAVLQKVGDFYTSCMDEEAANKKRSTPLKPEFDRITAVKDKTQMIEVMAHESLIGPNPLFSFYSSPDIHNANMTIAFIDQGGIVLPDRDYYLKDDPDMVAIRKTYVDHVAKMFILLGQSPEQAKKSADAVLKIETELARAAMDRTLRRDPKTQDHKMPLADIEAQAPNFHLSRYFAATGAPSFKDLNVSNPEFFKALNSVIDKIPLEDWKTYMTWQVVNVGAPWLSDDFVQEDFKLIQALSGQKELKPRWKRCIGATNGFLGEALGQLYVDETFGTEGKDRTLKMVDALEHALQQDITTLPWMTETTKKEALIKLKAIRNKIGYPEKWRDYSKLEIRRNDLPGNLERGSEFEAHRQLNKIGKPVDKAEWDITPPTVNAFYNPEHNEIVFPAAILQPPFFYANADDAVNYGGIGAVIGHEITHGFDDEGRQFDAAGNLKEWWTEEDAAKFKQRAEVMVKQFDGYQPLPGLHINGHASLGENIADHGGLSPVASSSFALKSSSVKVSIPQSV